MAFKGIDVRQSTDRLIFRASLKGSDGAKVTTGVASIKLYELQSDATLRTYDFSDNTFKTGAATTGSGLPTHRQSHNSTHDTGLWTYGLTTLTGFTRGNIYFAEVFHPSAYPTSQEREFQFGDAEGDFVVTSGGLVGLSGNVNLNLAQTVHAGASGTVGTCLTSANVQGAGQWSISGTNLVLKYPDGSTVYRVFTLDSATTPTSRT